jgi:hypothetical protein
MDDPRPRACGPLGPNGDAVGSMQRGVRMTIDELEAFVTMARTSNIGAAAKRLGVPQATLSDPRATP